MKAAAAILGTTLRVLEVLNEKTTQDTVRTHQGPSTGLLHRDGHLEVVNINGRSVDIRHPDPDYVLIFCAVPAPAGGESVVVDGYRLIERIRSEAPDLYQFLVTVDVDIWARKANPELHRVPKICRMVEWTRGGRMVLQTAELAQPLSREARWDDHDRHLQSYVDLLATLADQIQGDTTLDAGEVLVLDNYRCLHGVREHKGKRTMYILRCKTENAL